ncbi:hypothetical protein ACIA6E_28920 [Streptomyces sp. NPDC051815]|uniref:hypothetical protein n=1 Tax=Streptomyces sp. NPDC051815 TaxID=3365674 RepID=UPI003799B768
MTSSWRVMRWVGAAVGVVALAVFLTLVGLDRADKWSSVLSLFFSGAGFVLAVVGHLRQRREPDPLPSPTARGGSIAANGDVEGSSATYTGPDPAGSTGSPATSAGPAVGSGPEAESGSIAAGGTVRNSRAKRAW